MNHACLSRRAALGVIASATALPNSFAEVEQSPILRIGVMDGMLGLPCKPESFAAAAALQFAGVQVTIGGVQPSGHLLLSDPNLQQNFLEASQKSGVALPNTYLDVLHRDCLKSDTARALGWIREGVTATRALGAKVLMIVFFGKCAVEQESERKAIVAPLREAGKMAADAGVVIGFETTVSAPANLTVVEDIGSPAFKIWYDIGNSTNMGHFDVPAEIRALGRDRICGIHIKDKTYLDAGAVRVPDAIEAIRDIGFDGFAMLETSAPTGDKIADLRRNLEILRKDLAGAGLKEVAQPGYGKQNWWQIA